LKLRQYASHCIEIDLVVLILHERIAGQGQDKPSLKGPLNSIRVDQAELNAILFMSGWKGLCATML